MRGGPLAPGGILRARRVKSLCYRTGVVLVILGLVWGISQISGQPGQLVRDGVDYLLTRSYDFSELAAKAGDYLGVGPGLDVKVMGPLDRDVPVLPALPVTGQLVRGFGWQQDQDGWPRFSQGIELQVAGNALVRAVLPGRVARAGADRALGKLVIIEHSDQVFSLYGRLGEVGVRTGQDVVQGQMIGTTQGTYFHFELREGDHLVDPILRLQQQPE